MRRLFHRDRSTAANDPRPAASCAARTLLNVFQRIRLRVFRACGRASGRPAFASWRRHCRTVLRARNARQGEPDLVRHVRAAQRRATGVSSFIQNAAGLPWTNRQSATSVRPHRSGSCFTYLKEILDASEVRLSEARGISPPPTIKNPALRSRSC